MRIYKILAKSYTQWSKTLNLKGMIGQTSATTLTSLFQKLTKGKENQDKLLNSQCVCFNKEGLGFNPKNKKNSYKNFFDNEIILEKSQSHIIP